MYKKVVLVLLLAAVSSRALAEWVVISGNDNVTIYADTGNIIKSGNVVRMWSMTDLMSPVTSTSGARMMSAKLQQEYDCKKGLARALYFSAYSANMGEGKVVLSKSFNDKWYLIPPDKKSLINFACGMQ